MKPARQIQGKSATAKLTNSYWFDRNGRIKIGPNVEIFIPLTPIPNGLGSRCVSCIHSVTISRDLEKDSCGSRYFLPTSLFSVESSEMTNEGVKVTLSFNVAEYNRLEPFLDRLLSHAVKQDIPFKVEFLMSDDTLKNYDVRLVNKPYQDG